MVCCGAAAAPHFPYVRCTSVLLLQPALLFENERHGSACYINSSKLGSQEPHVAESDRLRVVAREPPKHDADRLRERCTVCPASRLRHIAGTFRCCRHNHRHFSSRGGVDCDDVAGKRPCALVTFSARVDLASKYNDDALACNVAGTTRGQRKRGAHRPLPQPLA